MRQFVSKRSLKESSELRLDWHAGALREGKLFSLLMKTRKARGSIKVVGRAS